MPVSDISFGTDGFRGLIAKDFSFENIKRIAQGLSDYLAYKNFKSSDKKIIIGYDRRFMSLEFAKQFALILKNNGINCAITATPVPTPLISVLTSGEKFFLGVMITASHNHYLYNGVKIKYQGRSAPPAMTAEIESYIPKNYNFPVPNSEIAIKDFRSEYISYLKSRFNITNILSKLKGKIIIDFMHGSGAEFYEDIFGNNKNIITLNNRRDPLFGKFESPEPVEKNLADLIKAVKENKAIMGIALDGDGDRFALVNDKGIYMTPCQIAPMLLDYLLKTQKKSGKIVQAVSMGYLTKKIAKANDMLVEEVPVGFKFIADKMISEDVFFGVEESGGYSWKGNIPERDGILTALCFIQMIVDMKKNISEIYSEIKSKYGDSAFLRRDFKISNPVTNKHSFAVKIKKKLQKKVLDYKINEINTLDGLKVILENEWWFLIRPSGTEPLIRVYAETSTNSNTEKLLDFVKNLVG